MSVFDEIRAAAFDIDGTLYPNWQMYIWGFPQILFHPRLLHAYVQTRKEIRKIDMKNEKFEDVQARLAAVKLELLPSHAAEKIENRLYQPWAKQTRIIRPVKGLRPFLEELKTRGVALYALSDFPVGRKLNYLGIDDLFEKALCSEDYGRLKPDPAPFKALQKAAGVPFGEILYFGNSYDKDVEGARSVGMKTAYIASRVKKGQTADLIYQNYEQLTEMLHSR